MQTRTPDDYFYYIQQPGSVTAYEQKNDSYMFDAWSYYQTVGKGPYWIASTPGMSGKRKKKIILSCYYFVVEEIEVANEEGYDEELPVQAVALNDFLKDHFEVYFLNSRTKKIEKINPDLKSYFNEKALATPANQKKMKEFLIHEGKNPEHYFIFDDTEAQAKYDEDINRNLSERYFTDDNENFNSFLSLIHHTQSLEGVKKIRYIFDGKTQEDIIDFSSFSEIEELKIENAKAKQIIFPKKLKFLYLIDCENLENIINFSSCSEIEKVSIERGNVKKIIFSKKLKFLSLFDCQLEAIMDFSSLTEIEKLVIEKADAIKKIIFPKKVKYLYLEECKNLENIDDCENLTNLSELHCSDMSGLKYLNIEKLEQLETLVLNKMNVIIDKFPSHLINLEITIDDNSIDGIPKNIEHLEILNENNFKETLELNSFIKARKIVIYYYDQLKKIINLPPNIEIIELFYCKNFQELPDLSPYKNIRSIKIIGCENFKTQDPCIEIIPGDYTILETIKNKPEKKQVIFQDRARLLDDETYTDPNTVSTPRYSIYKGAQLERIHPATYRHEVKNQIEIDSKRNIQLAQSYAYWTLLECKHNDITEKDIETMTQNDFIVEWDIPFEWLGQEIKIPTKSLFSHISLVPTGCDVYYNARTCEYKMKIPRNLKRPLRYMGTERIHALLPVPPVPLHIEKLDLDVKHLLAHMRSHFHLLDEKQKRIYCLLIDEKEITEDKKIRFALLLMEYFNDPHYGNRPLSDVTIGLSTAFRVFFEKTGSCRHRAFAFVLLCQYYDIPARYIENDIHAYAEIYIKNKWYISDVGGAVTAVNFPDVRPSLLRTKKSIEDSHKAEEMLIDSPDEDKEMRINDSHKDKETLLWESYFSPEAIIPSDIQEISQLIHWFLKEKNILIRLNTFNETRDVYEALANTAKKDNIPLFYVESEKDIEDFLQLQSIESGQIKESKKGPLIHFLEEDQGTLVINWERFTPSQIAAYKSIMDDSPTLKKWKIHPNIHIINLVTPENRGCEAFLSRTSHVEWPVHIPKPVSLLSFTPLSADEERKENKEFIAKELFKESFGWQKELIGDVKLNEKGFQFIPGAIHEAIKTGKSLSLIDAPLNDPPFKAFLYRLQIDKKYIENGEIKEVPENFTIKLYESKEFRYPQKFTTMTPEDLQKNEVHIFYLNSTNFQLLFQKMIIQNRQMKIIDGWLNRQKSGTTKKVIVLTEPLSESQKLRLRSYLRKSIEEITWVNMTKTPEINNDAKSITQREFKEEGAYILTTDDPYYVATLLKKKKNKLYSLSVRTSPTEIIDHVKIKEEGDILTFLHQKKDIAERIIKGETIILQGTLTEDMYHALESLFKKPPYIQFKDADKPIFALGKLIVVTSPLTFKTPVADIYSRRKNIPERLLWKQYSKKLKFHPAFNQYKNQLWNIYKYTKKHMAHGQIGSPPVARMNYFRLKNILDSLAYPMEENQDNLIKSFLLYDYDKDTEQYARLNAIIKKRLSPANDLPGVRVDKLSQIPDEPEYFWRRLNCLNAAAILSLKKMNQECLKAFLEKKEYSPILKNKDPQRKIQKRITHYLTTHHAVVLKGPAGTGKSFIASTIYEDASLCFGEKGIQTFLDSKPCETKPAILVIDEANLYQKGTWDFLLPHISSANETSCIVFQEKKYELNKHFKIIFTCNPESYPGREYHDVLQDTPTVYVKAWTDDTIKQTLLYPLFQRILKTSLSFEDITSLDLIIKTYHCVETLLPANTLSLRDIQEVTRRFIYFLQLGKKPKQAAYEAVMTEWRHSFIKESNRDVFLKIIDEHFTEVDKHISVLQPFKFPMESHFYLSTAQRNLFNALKQDIELFDAVKEDKTKDGALPVKSGYVIEGPSGIGKSKMSRQVLKSLGYTECTHDELMGSKVELMQSKVELIRCKEEWIQNNDDFSQRFFQFTLSGDINKDEKLLRRAFDRGCKVIIDELNLDPTIESLLNYLLTGRTPENDPPTVRGFYVLASQNSSLLDGRNVTPPALLNRLRAYYVDDYDKTQLVEIVQQALPNFKERKIDPNPIVEAFFEKKKQHPKLVNTRTFLKGLQKIKNVSDFSESKEYVKKRHFQNDLPIEVSQKRTKYQV